MGIGIWVVFGIVCALFLILYVKESLRYKSVETEVTGIVQTCKRGAYRPNPYYQNLAVQSQLKKDYAMYGVYMTKAQSKGHYEYCITVEVADKQCVVVRDRWHEPGSQMKVIEKKMYQDGKWIETTYK